MRIEGLPRFEPRSATISLLLPPSLDARCDHDHRSDARHVLRVSLRSPPKLGRSLRSPPKLGRSLRSPPKLGRSLCSPPKLLRSDDHQIHHGHHYVHDRLKATAMMPESAFTITKATASTLITTMLRPTTEPPRSSPLRDERLHVRQTRALDVIPCRRALHRVHHG